MLYIKALHIFFMVTWFAGLFYLPRLFVYHADAKDEISIERFMIMERKLYYGIMMPGAFFTLLFGGYLIYLVPAYLHMMWLHAKLSLVLLLIIYHFYLGHLRQSFKLRQNKHGHKFYRILNELPVFLLIAIVLLAVVKPL